MQFNTARSVIIAHNLTGNKTFGKTIKSPSFIFRFLSTVYESIKSFMSHVTHVTMAVPLITPVRHRILTVAFLFPDSRYNPLLNTLVARISKHKTCHVELVFEDDMAFSIFAGSNLFFKQRTFNNPDYVLIPLSIPNAEYATLYNFCQSVVTHDICFTDVGMVFSYLQPKHCPFINTAPSMQLGQTFCSKIVAEALQFAGTPEVEHLIPCTTTPSCLYDAFKDSPRKIMSSVGSRRDKLRQIGVVAVTTPRVHHST